MSRSSDRTHTSERGKGNMDTTETCSVYVNTGGPVCPLWQRLCLTDNFSSPPPHSLLRPPSSERNRCEATVFWVTGQRRWTCRCCSDCFFFVAVSQSNSSLKKHRSRSIFSPFFCCFRNYNVDPPLQNNKTCSLPPPAEENSGSPKVCACACVCIFVLNDLFLKKNPKVQRFYWCCYYHRLS